MYEKNALNNFKDVLGKYCAINQFVELSKGVFWLSIKRDTEKGYICGVSNRICSNSDKL